MRRFSLLLVSLIVLTVQTALAQNFSVKGTVVSAEDNEPLIGATILQEGSTNGVVTDIDGNYTIEVKGASKATLVISYLGMVTQKHPVNKDWMPARTIICCRELMSTGSMRCSTTVLRFRVTNFR